MKKIAEVAGVSVSTVSLVLSGKGRISELVKNKVLDVAKSMGYKSPLYSNRCNTVAVLYTIDKEWKHVLGFINEILVEFEANIVGEGLTPILLPISFNESSELIKKKLSDLSPLAVCSIHYVDEEIFSSMESKGVPVVIINRSILQGKFCTVCVDDFQGAYEGGKILLEGESADNAVFLGYEKGNMTSIIDDRAYGFQKALLEVGCSNVQNAVYYIKEPLLDGVVELLKSFEKSSFPRAIFVYDDYLALFVVAGLKSLGLSIYKDVRLLAPGDTLDYGHPFTPQISTMSINTRLLGEFGAKMVIERLSGKIGGMQVYKVRQEFVRRRSC